MAAPPLRILCLHGFLQNGTVMRVKTGAWRKKLNGVAELVFVSAQHVSPMPEGISEEDQARLQRLYDSEDLAMRPYAWWVAKQEGTKYVGAEASMQQIRDVLDEQGPFHGVLGFSQGAVFAAMLASIYQQPQDPLRYGSQHPAFQFAILVSGFKARSPDYERLFAQPINCPSLHVIGQRDEVVPPEGSRLLVDMFENAQVLEHDNGQVELATLG